MRQTRLHFDKFHGANLPKLAVLAVILTVCLPTGAMAQQRGQKTFASAHEAIEALVTAAKNNDERAMLEILGPDGKEIVSSGDATEDIESRANLVERYQEMHRLVKEPDGTTILYIGAHNWPMPIPLMNKAKVWYFDTEAGKKEILYRRIGRNELSAVRVCQEAVAAQKEYFAQHHEYAQKIFSDEGKQDGLYWKAANGEPQSPIGPLVASAIAQGYPQNQQGGPTPYRGYYFHILTAKGKTAAGFAFVGYPAEYRSSGVMTFIISEDGVVYEKDLGRKTEVLAKAMKEYNASSGWHKAEEQKEEAANEPAK